MKAIARQWALTLLALLMSVAVYGQTWNDYRDKTWDHTKAGDFWYDMLTIETPEQLAQLSWLVNEQGETFENKIIILNADIDLHKEVNGKRVRWIPIGSKNNNVFKGLFVSQIETYVIDGDRNTTHTISGMYVEASGSIAYVGLFGHCQGFLGYFTLDSPEVKFSLSQGYWQNIGTVCGMLDGSSHTAYVRKGDYQHNTLPCGIRGVTVRNAKVTVQGTDYGALGGIVGLCKGYGVSHSTMTGTITTNGTISTGGVVGITEAYTIGETTTTPGITDCTVNATINSFSNNSVGGIVGDAKNRTVVNACSAMGTITNQRGKTGGIVGVMEAGTTVSGCACTATIKGTENVGGIVGLMQQAASGTSKVEHCAYSGHIDASVATYAGGLCGKMEWEKNEHITDCLFLGTMSMPDNKANCNATVGYNTKPIETVSMCYYDKNLFGGNVAPGLDSHVTCVGLTTAELTSGEQSDVPFLTVSSGDAGFTLTAGRYPTVFSKALWAGYSIFNDYTGGESWNALFAKQRMENVNYQAGAWLCSLPAILGRGDVAYDFVSTVTASNQNQNMTLDDGRTLSLQSTVSFADAPCIRVNGKTATAIGQGDFLMSIVLTTGVSVVNYDRPAPVGGTKQLLLNAAYGKPWDGSVATTLECGNGTAEDPYIIRNGAQLAYAVTNNKEGKFYEQLCNIVLNEGLIVNADLVASAQRKKWVTTTTWAGHYDGAGHIIYGVFLDADDTSLFGDVGVNGEISNVGIAESVMMRGGSGILAHNVDGHIVNCFVQGVSKIICPLTSIRSKTYGISRAGGICSTVGLNNPDAVVEDCLTALFNGYAYSDYTPFVSLDERNRGVVRNCLSVVPVYYANTDWTDFNFSAEGHNYIRDCYWLKGYEPSATGQTLDEIGQALSRRSCWQWSRGYFPMLKTFAESDIAKLMMLPVRTDKDYDKMDVSTCLLGFNHQLEFEPGGAQWELINNSRDYVDADGDMGIITPQTASLDPAYMSPPTSRLVIGLVFLKGTLGRSSIYIPMLTMSYDVSQGISFVDDNARQACLQAFDSDGNGWLSLAEVKAVTSEKALNAFQTPRAKSIRQFPEFRFFKNITTLTSQLNGLSSLEEVQLPYALKTLGAEAFKGCDRLKTVTIPLKLEEVKPRAFYGSSVDNIRVDLFNTNFVERDGILLTTDNRLVAYPNGRSGEECVVSGVVSAIDDGAVYKISGLRRLYFDTSDYTTVPQLSPEGIVTDDGSLMDVYVSDATEDQSLVAAYKKNASWNAYVEAKKLHLYYPLKIDSRLVVTDTDNNKRYVGTMCIGFDTELPAALTPYIVEEAVREEYKAYLTPMPRSVPATAAVIIYASEPGIYRLTPLDEKLAMWPLYNNRLVGTNRDGLPLNQYASAQGSIMMPEYNSAGTQVGFYHDRSKEVQPYMAYLTYNTVGMDKDIARYAHYDIVYTWEAQPAVSDGEFSYNIYKNQFKGTNRAIIRRYNGSDHHVVVPATVRVHNGDADVVQVEARAFRSSSSNIWSIDMTKLTKMDFISTDRTDYDAPFSGLNDRTIIYLPEGKAAPADNVVVGYECKKLTLTDGRDFLPPVDFEAAEVTFSREFSAESVNDAWRSRAYTVSLPFDAECPADATLYQLKGISEDDRQAIFTPTGNNNITAGEPYLMVVNKGAFQLSATNAYIEKEVSAEGTPVGAWPASDGDPIANWEMTKANIDASAAARQQMYVLQADGTFKRVVDDYTETTVSSFRSVFKPQGQLMRNVYIVALENADGTASLLGADNYTSDAQMPDYGRFDTDKVPMAIWTASNKTLSFTALPYTTKVGDNYGGQTVTYLWREAAVTATGNKAPQWTEEAYAHNATNIIVDPSFADYKLQSVNGWFKNMEKLTVIDISDIDFSQITDARELFAGCTSLTTIFSNDSSPIPFDVPNNGMFEGCTKLKGQMAYDPKCTDGNWASLTLGYLTPTPYVLWCADTKTLHFVSGSISYEVGDTFQESLITQLWRGQKVYNVGWKTPDWNSVRNDVKRVLIDSNFAVQRPKSLFSWFAFFSNTESIDGLEYLNTSEATNLNSLFIGCTKLKTLYVNTFDVSRVTNASSCFNNCPELTTIWCDKTWKIATASAMFTGSPKVVGAVEYDVQRRSGEMANPETGYFTRVPVVELIDLADNSEILKRYDGQHVHATYNRNVSAIQNADGSWTSKAYAVCLPFGIDVYQQVGNHEDVSVYYLQNVTKDNEFIFREARYREDQWAPNVMLPGEPYVVIVKKGTFPLQSNDVVLTVTPKDMEVTMQVGDDNYELCGYWKGTFSIISNDDAAALKAHTMSSDGKFRRISNEEERYRIAKVGTFRAFYSSIEDNGYPSYKPLYKLETQGDDDDPEEDVVLNFPADTYDGDDASLFPTGIRPVIHTIDNDGTHRYFDLQGRQLPGKPNGKAVYIDNGKKVIN